MRIWRSRAIIFTMASRANGSGGFRHGYTRPVLPTLREHWESFPLPRRQCRRGQCRVKLEGGWCAQVGEASTYRSVRSLVRRPHCHMPRLRILERRYRHARLWGQNCAFLQHPAEGRVKDPRLFGCSLYPRPSSCTPPSANLARRRSSPVFR